MNRSIPTGSHGDRHSVADCGTVRECRRKQSEDAGGRLRRIPRHAEHDSLQRIYTGKANISGMALNADSTIAELLREKPESAQVLFRFGMGCLGCAIANNETVREAAQAHGIPLDEMLSALGIPEK